MANGRLLDTNIIIDYLKNKLETPAWFANPFSMYVSQITTVKAVLRKQGTPIPENDMWLAATALAFDLIMVTGDKHFSSIPNLQVEQM